MRFTKKGLSFLLLLALAVVSINHQTISRLYTVITLFDKESIVYNFSNMDKAFLYKTIKQQGKPFTFEYAKHPLPESFTYRDKSTNVNQFLKRRATTALLVVKNDRITFEDYYLETKPTDKRISWSMAKSFVSVLFGIQVDAGRIDIEKPVDFYLPELIGSGYEQVKVKHILQMSSGVNWNEDYDDFYSDINKMGRALAINGSLDEMTMQLTAESAPGNSFHYVSMDTHVIGMIIRKVSGKSLVQLLQEDIWDKIGMASEAKWITDSHDAEFALGGLSVTTQDYARFGRLLAHDGLWTSNLDGISKSEQIVSQDWIKAATTATEYPLENPSGNLGYGYQIWLPPQAEAGEFFCVGVYGQYIYINQQDNIVIVKNSADKGHRDSLGSKQETIAFFRAVVRSLKN